jgi:hypothetical protein
MMVCRASLPALLAQDSDLQDARRRFESHLLRTTQPILERYQFVGRGSARMMRDVHAAYVAELRIIVQLNAWQLTPSPNPDPSLVREFSCPGWGLKGFSDEEATQCRADRGLASAS